MHTYVYKTDSNDSKIINSIVTIAFINIFNFIHLKQLNLIDRIWSIAELTTNCETLFWSTDLIQYSHIFLYNDAIRKSLKTSYDRLLRFCWQSQSCIHFEFWIAWSPNVFIMESIAIPTQVQPIDLKTSKN